MQCLYYWHISHNKRGIPLEVLLYRLDLTLQTLYCYLKIDVNLLLLILKLS